MFKSKNAFWGSLTARILLAVMLLVIASLACNRPQAAKQVVSGDGTAFVETSVAQTMMAVEGDTAPDQQPSDGDGQDALPASETPEPETPTNTPTITDTPTPDVARVYASANTNCRTGQGTYFPWLVTIQQGETPEAVGIDTSGDYWYVRRPDVPSQFCWMWGKYATPQGPWQSLPVYTPIPTPTPGFDFQVSYVNVTQCMSNWLVQFQIDNNGSETLESWKSSGTDNSGSLVNSPNQQDEFYFFDHCTLISKQVDLTPGEGSYFNVVFNDDSTGHNLTVRIKVCTEDGMAGKCLKKEFDITP